MDNNSFLERLFGDAEFNRFSIISMAILAIGCLGGVAVGVGAINNTFQLSLIVMSTMLSLAMILGVAPMKYVIYSCAAAIAIDFLMILINLL